MPPILRRLLALSTLAAAPAGAQQMPGYAPASAAAERTLEGSVIRRPDAAGAARLSEALSREPHVAGTDAQARTRDYVIERMKEMGLSTEVRAYEVYLPHATGVRIWRVSPEPVELSVQEPPLPTDPVTELPQYPPANGYSAPGDVTAEVVFVNYGLIEDYATLDSLGVSVKGKIAVARYGRTFRGIKAREAEKHGAAALLLYTDPQDDGYVPRRRLPRGADAAAVGLQRGSVYNGDGDPWTPGYPSRPRARHVCAGRGPRPPHPRGGDRLRQRARSCSRDCAAPPIPQAWQGGLPFRYHVGPGPVAARVRVEIDADRAARGYKRIWDTFGIVRGQRVPGRDGPHRRPPRRVGAGRRRQRERHGERARGRPRGRGRAEGAATVPGARSSSPPGTPRSGGSSAPRSTWRTTR